MTPHDANLRAVLIERAKNLAAECGWTWLDPIEITESRHAGELVWVIQSHYMWRGMNARVVLRQADLAVVDAAYLPR